MGAIHYDSAVIRFDDRLLSHLHLVIMNKLRRREGFVMSWLDSASVGDGRSSIWIDHGFPIYFKFDGSRLPAMNEDWLRRLTESANSSSGLIVTDENGELARSRGLEHKL